MLCPSGLSLDRVGEGRTKPTVYSCTTYCANMDSTWVLRFGSLAVSLTVFSRSCRNSTVWLVGSSVNGSLKNNVLHRNSKFDETEPTGQWTSVLLGLVISYRVEKSGTPNPGSRDRHLDIQLTEPRSVGGRRVYKYGGIEGWKIKLLQIWMSFQIFLLCYLRVYRKWTLVGNNCKVMRTNNMYWGICIYPQKVSVYLSITPNPRLLTFHVIFEILRSEVSWNRKWRFLCSCKRTYWFNS